MRKKTATFWFRFPISDSRFRLPIPQLNLSPLLQSIKAMKQLVLFAIVTLLSMASFAQKHKGHQDPLLSHAAELNLSAEQSARLADLKREHRSAMEELKLNENITAAEKEARIHALRLKYREASKAVLTAEQLNKLQTLATDSTYMNGKNSDDNDLQQTLQLSEEQTAKLKALQLQDQAEMKNIQQDTTITEANKKFRLEELKKDRRRELESILTPDQQRKYKEMRNRKPKNDVKQ
jgi:Spy/CpxP family protein refolding chaperone